MNPSIQLTRVIRLFLVALVCFGLSPAIRAVSPPPDGGYPGRNTAEGDFALFSTDTSCGDDNTAIGFNALYSNTCGSQNVAIGGNALFMNDTGIANTATGVNALYSNTFGLENTATGGNALHYNTSGNDNTATGVAALTSNTTGSFNTATGGAALASNTTGENNTASGSAALLDNTTGFNNTATGVLALANNSRGANNTATGSTALYSNESGTSNTANGIEALRNNTTGSFNTADGVGALENNTTGIRNIALGVGAGSNLTTGNHNIDIGNPGIPDEAKTIRIGTSGTQTATFIAGIRGATVQGALPVVVGSAGRLGTLPSSVRFKNAIKPMHKASETILALKPVTFRYKNQTDTTPQFGLLAEDVAKVNPDLVVRDENGEVYTVRYDAVNAMLLNEFLKEHWHGQEQDATIARLQKQIEALAASLQKVSAQLEANKPAPQVVNNNQ